MTVEESRKLILSREQYYLDLMFLDDEPNTYNILTTAGSSLGFLHLEETLTKMKEIKTGKNNPMHSKTHSPETKTKISKALSGENHYNFGKTHLAQTLALMSEAKMGNKNLMSKKVFVYSFNLEMKETTLYKSFDTYTEATKHFNCSNATISKYLNKNKLYKNQWFLTSSSKE